MQSEKNSLSDRLLDFAAEVIKLAVRLNRTPVGHHIGMQIMRSATSAGANYEETCSAQSRADFVHKLQLVLKELRESMFWLRLIEKSDLILSPDLETLIKEANELANIVGKSVVTAKKSR